MRFNLYHACAMAAVLAFGGNAIQLKSNEETELAECYDDEYDIDNYAEVDADSCPKPCAANAPKSPYEEGIRAKVQSALWDAHGNAKLGNKPGCGC